MRSISTYTVFYCIGAVRGVINTPKLKKVIIIRIKGPKCIKCGKVMTRLYQKKSYKNQENKYKIFWSETGWICNHAHYPYVIIDDKKEYFGIKRLVDVLDIDFLTLLKAIENIRIY